MTVWVVPACLTLSKSGSRQEAQATSHFGYATGRSHP